MDLLVRIVLNTKMKLSLITMSLAESKFVIIKQLSQKNIIQNSRIQILTNNLMKIVKINNNF